METLTNKALYGQKGRRKQKVNLMTMVFLFTGFAFAGWMKMDFQLYLCYSAALVGANTAFAWGNIKEGQSDASMVIAGKKPPE